MSVRTKKTKVWNKGREEHVETFQNKTYKIAAGGFIVLNRREAIGLRGQYSDKEKMLEIEHLNGSGATPSSFVCNSCGESFSGEDQLKAHLSTHKKEVFVDNELEDAIDESKKEEKKVNLVTEKAEKPEKEYICPFCAIENGSPTYHLGIAALQEHLETHRSLTKTKIQDYVTKVKREERG